MDEYVSTESPPGAPSSSDVAAALREVAPAVGACGAGRRGFVTATVRFNPQGTVGVVFVHPSYIETPVGVCVERAVRIARVPPFVAPHFTVTYRFPIQ
ncbi:MAG: hypothetical protein IPF99_31275 [Deltaproteobacteria bacterium]|jgi:hypothetical protein|nr:hypothetical protein [Deltaproteobacteria bacterium]